MYAYFPIHVSDVHVSYTFALEHLNRPVINQVTLAVFFFKHVESVSMQLLLFYCVYSANKTTV